ncbi:hypothetical protein Bhyg_14796, partial [Pseudolycoriella hygida]
NMKFWDKFMETKELLRYNTTMNVIVFNNATFHALKEELVQVQDASTEHSNSKNATKAKNKSDVHNELEIAITKAMN